MTVHRINYEGPPSFAVRAARMLAEAEGVELTSSRPPARRDGAGDVVVLALTVEGTTEAVAAAVAGVRDLLPPEAKLEIEDNTIDEA